MDGVKHILKKVNRPKEFLRNMDGGNEMIRKTFLKKTVRAAVGTAALALSLFLVMPCTAYAANPTYPSVTPGGTTPTPTTPTGSVQIDEDTMNALDNFNRTLKLANGQTVQFNALCYFLNYSDLREAFGADPYKLWDHFQTLGYPKEHRVANTILDPTARVSRSKFEYVVPSYQKTKKQQNGMTVIPDEYHSNGGMNRRQENEARSVALQLARHVYDHVNTLGDGSQIQMLAYATGIVNGYCNAGWEMTQADVQSSNDKIYRTSYGVFIAHRFTSAGATRALGLIIDYLDQLWYADYQNGLKETYPPFKWVHVNANTWNDQWCQVVCDNHEAYADPIEAWAGYGKHPNWGGKKVDFQTYYPYAFESDIINTRPKYIDGGPDTISSDPTNNKDPMAGQNAQDYPDPSWANANP